MGKVRSVCLVPYWSFTQWAVTCRRSVTSKTQIFHSTNTWWEFCSCSKLHSPKLFVSKWLLQNYVRLKTVHFLRDTVRFAMISLEDSLHSSTIYLCRSMTLFGSHCANHSVWSLWVPTLMRKQCHELHFVKTVNERSPVLTYEKRNSVLGAARQYEHLIPVN